MGRTARTVRNNNGHYYKAAGKAGRSLYGVSPTGKSVFFNNGHRAAIRADGTFTYKGEKHKVPKRAINAARNAARKGK